MTNATIVRPIEVTTLGPGYGECTVVHIGSNQWIIVDSCIDPTTNEPAALVYLRSVGVNADDVVLIVATHWHDDHVRGLARLMEACGSATFCLSSVFTEKEFYRFAEIHKSKSKVDHNTSGADEITAVLAMLSEDRQRKRKRATAERVLLNISGQEFDHGLDVQVMSLSPSDDEHERFLLSLSKLIPDQGETSYRAPTIHGNDTAVVLWISVGPHCILLGADLEETRGAWSRILDLDTRPKRHKAAIFKIPHHGSRNGHHDGVWEEMLAANPTCLLTPYNRGHKLPLEDDVARIVGYSANSFATKRIKLNKTKSQRSRDIQKLIQFSGKQMELIDQRPGRITAQLTDPSHSGWSINLTDGACHLNEIHL